MGLYGWLKHHLTKFQLYYESQFYWYPRVSRDKPPIYSNLLTNLYQVHMAKSGNQTHNFINGKY
jgi:hypothetical protein